MNILTIVTIGFLFMEAVNVVTLYFDPGSKYANGVGIFKAWKSTTRDPEIHAFVTYLVNWVAGTKMIFIFLLIAILIVSDDQTLLFAGIALVASIGSFFWRLFPLIRSMDSRGQIEPKNYSQTLGWMIGAFILIFAAAVCIALCR